MDRGLATATTLYAAGLGALAFTWAVRGGTLGGRLLAGCAVLQCALLAQAVAALVALARGEGPAEPLVWGCYLAVSLGVVPAGARYALAGAGRRGDVLVVACTALAAAVVVVRLRVTWGAG